MNTNAKTMLMLHMKSFLTLIAIGFTFYLPVRFPSIGKWILPLFFFGILLFILYAYIFGYYEDKERKKSLKNCDIYNVW